MPLTDTLENAKRLENLGFSHDQAQGRSELIEDAVQEDNRDLKEFLRGELGDFRNEFRAEINGFRNEFRSELQRELRFQMLWFFAMLVGVVSIAFTLFKFLP